MKKLWTAFNHLMRSNPPGEKWLMFILFLSLLMLINTIFEYVIPHHYAEIQQIIRITDFFICGSFFLDFCWRLLSSQDRRNFFLHIGWIDLLASVPYIHLFRLGKLFFVFRVIRDLRSAERVLSFLFASKVTITLLFSFLVFVSSIVIAAMSVLYFERTAPGSTITTPGDAVWWALNLASTCGNTDSVPVTLGGRVIGGALIIVGYGLFSMNAGILSSWFLNNLSSVKAKMPR